MSSPRNFPSNLKCVLFMWLAIVTVVILVGNQLLKDSYKQGQIDSALGEQWYHLYNHDDGTKTWEKVEDPYSIPERYDTYNGGK